MVDVTSFIADHYFFYLVLLFSVLGNLTVHFVLKRKSRSQESIFCMAVKLVLTVVSDLCISVCFSSVASGLDGRAIMCAAAFSAGASLYLAVRFLNNMTKSVVKRTKKINAVGIGTFLYFLFYLLVFRQSKICYWGSLWYAADYSLGLGSRFFIGSFLRLFSGSFLDNQTAVVFCYVFLVILIVLLSIAGNNMYSVCKDNYRLAFLYIWVMFLVSPGSVVCYWYSENMFGRLEMYGLVIGVGCLLLYKKLGINKITFTLITILSVLSIAIYQGNVFMYYPLIMMIFIWEIMNNFKSLSKWLYGLINFAATSLTFLYFQFGSRINFDNAEQMANYIGRNTNIPICFDALDDEFFKPRAQIYTELNIEYYNDTLPRESTIVTIIVLVPLIIMFIGLYAKCIKSYKSRHLNKSILSSVYVYFLSLLVIIIPQFVLNVDWGRWMVSETVLLFMGFLFLLWMKDEGAIEAGSALSNWINRHRFVSILVLAYIAGLNKFDHYVFIKQVRNIMQWLIDHGLVFNQ